jgi:hypothetical protein
MHQPPYQRSSGPAAWPSPASAALRLRDVLRLDQTAPDRIARQIDAVAHAELTEDVGSVAFDGLDAEDELRRDLLGALSLADELQDLELAWRQQFGGCLRG